MNDETIKKEEKLPVKKMVYTLVIGLVVGLMGIIAIFYVGNYIPAEDRNNVWEVLKIVILLVMAADMAKALYSEPKIKTVRTIEEMRDQPTVRLLSMLITAVIMSPVILIMAHFDSQITSTANIVTLLLVFFILEDMGIRWPVAKYILKKGSRE